ncbi:MAG: ABC transporter permease [Muribaculaceae bacterium]|nr:ABC transporter permease [Muribaculaceae bacterium]
MYNNLNFIAVNPFKSISVGFVQLSKVFRKELSIIFHDPGVMLFFFALPLAYPIVYTVIYNTEVVENLPFAVVDHARTPESRELVRMIDATPEMQLYDYVPEMGEARRLWAESKVVGILEIPSDYSSKIANGQQSHVSFFCQMSLLLRYRAALSALTSVQLVTGTKITEERMNTIGLPASTMSASPVNVDTAFLGDTQQGFASFIIPGIVVLILQQSMILGICLIGGTASDRRRKGDYYTDRIDLFSSPVASVLGKALAYTLVYIPVTIYILHYIPVWFHLPHQGDAIDWMLFAVPLLFASAMIGLMFSHMMRQREDAFIYIVFTSVVFLFLSGLTWPRFAMPAFWYSIADCIPATWGVEGFIRINSNAATLAEESEPFLWLWGLTGIYFIGAVVLQALLRRRAIRATAKA